MSPRPRSRNIGFPDNLTKDKHSYRYRNPRTGKFTYLGTNQEKAFEAAKAANKLFAKGANEIIGADKTLSQVIEEFVEQCLPYKPWDTGTKANALYKLKLYKREHGKRKWLDIDRLWLGNWLKVNAVSNDAYNKHRERWVDLCKFAISRGYARDNEAEAVLKRSLSKKLESNRKLRRRLDLEGFRKIHDACPAWLRIAMDMSLVTLQARREIVRMRYTDERERHLFVIRDKTSGDSDMAFIKFPVTAQIAQIIAQSRGDSLVSPFIVHRSPEHRVRAYMAAKAHWTQVNEMYLTRTFYEVRNATGHWDGVPSRERPTFHEIRSLGGRLYIKAGYKKAYVRALMTHTDEKTTEIYLSGGELTSQHYLQVNADLRIDDLK